MSAFRRQSATNLAALLAGMAAVLQLMLASWSLLAAVSASADTGLPHALCLAHEADGGATSRGSPAPTAPTHDRCAYCCIWHAAIAIEPRTVALVAPVAVWRIIQAESVRDAAVVDTTYHPENARAPPLST